MTAQDARMVVWRGDYSIPDKTRAWIEDLSKPALPLVPKVSRAPFAPDAWHLLRFWLAAPLTLIVFIPAMLSGVFGAPAMLPGLYCAYRMLRSGQDSYGHFAMGGFQIGIAALIVSLPFGAGFLYAFGLVFGPLMAMCFRLIAGDWREDALPRTLGQTGDTAPVLGSSAPAPACASTA